MSKNALHPAPTLSRFQLTALVVCATLIPFLVVVGITSFAKPNPETKLDARVQLEIVSWPPNAPLNAEPNVSLKPAIRLTNPTREEWNNVTISLNKQFFHNSTKPLPAGESLVLPLEYFVTKGGNVPFRPASQTVTLVTVYAQVASYARAIYETQIAADVDRLP